MFKLLNKPTTASRRTLWKVIERCKKQWVDNKRRVLEVVFPWITHTTKATSREMDQMGQLQELIQTKEEFTALEAQSEVPRDLVLELELMEE